jgi:chromosome segregation ATPase
MLAATRETLSAVEDAHRRTLDELASTRADLERTATTLAGTKAELALAHDRLEAREAAFADLDGRHTTALNDLDAKRITVSDIETRLAMQIARGDEFERALTERRSELSDERKHLAELANNLLAEQERGMMLESRIRELESELEGKQAEISSLTDKVGALSSDGTALRKRLDEGAEAVFQSEHDFEETRARMAVLPDEGGDAAAPEQQVLAERVEDLRAAKASLEGALATAREERTRLERELRRLRRTGGTPDEIKAENAELRRLIAEVADSVLKSAGTDGLDPPVSEAEASIPNGRRKAAG